MTYYAHTKGPNPDDWQTLRNHLLNTAEKTRSLCNQPKLVEFASFAALIHDIGKYSAAFQRRLTGERGKVDHSTAGAQEVHKLFSSSDFEKAFAIVMEYCIAGHHGGLPDHGSLIDDSEEATLVARLKRKIEPYDDYRNEIDLDTVHLPNRFPIKPIPHYVDFSLSFFTRMIYSILVDADFQETEAFVNGGQKERGDYPSIEVLDHQLAQFFLGFENVSSPINQKRTETLKECLQKAALAPGFFRLTVPTGGGKTYSSLGFALRHALIHLKKRVIYVIPYTSIIEQNAAVFKNCLGENNVLEHHSNFDWNMKDRIGDLEQSDDITNNAIDKLKLAVENWDIPVIVTTNVQFFESLYSNRSSHCRKLHNITNSVIIFDEAQMLPHDYLKPCLFALYELVVNYGASVVFCTATQPALDEFMPPGVKIIELVTDPLSLFSYYQRVQVRNASKLTDNQLSSRIKENIQVLCIVNTRKHARELYRQVAGEASFHLSTLMCPAHRRKTIAEIKKRLSDGRICRVISTQIMEAGIDIDFPVGYRAVSGLDLIIQAAGRVNRERKASSGDLYVFEPDSEFARHTPAYIAQGAAVAMNIMRNYSDPICPEAVSAYYKMLNSLQSESASDSRHILDCFEKGIGIGLNFDFKTAAEKFRLIENTTVPVVIRYNQEVNDLLEKIPYHPYPLSFSRQLQQFTVNIYEREYDALASKGVIERLADTYSVLGDMSYYSCETGLALPESSSGEAIFFDG